MINNGYVHTNPAHMDDGEGWMDIFYPTSVFVCIHGPVGDFGIIIIVRT